MVKIKRVRILEQGIIDIIEQLDEYLNSLYPSESNHLTQAEEMLAENFVFYVAYEDEHIVGCGGIKIIPGKYAELKRLFVIPAARGKGIAKKLLFRLEEAAKNVGINIIRLETGSYQNEAIRMYEKSGYQYIEPFGNYTVDQWSVFMEKHACA